MKTKYIFAAIFFASLFFFLTQSGAQFEGKEPESFFFTEDDIPKGWKRMIDLSPGKKTDFSLRRAKGGKLMTQHFSLLNKEYLMALKESHNPDGSLEYIFLDGSKAKPSLIEVSVSISPSSDETDKIGNDLKNKNFTAALTGEGILAGGCKSAMEAHYFFLCGFVKGEWFVELSTRSLHAKQLEEWQESETKKRKGKTGNYIDQATASMELTHQLARIVAAKIP